MDELTFEIPLPPVTKKNHQRIIKTSDGKHRLLQSKQYVQYEEAAVYYVPRQHLHEGPYNVAAEFYMPTKRRVDLVNLLEALDDILVSSGLLTDDDFHHIGGHDGSRVYHDKDKPRTRVIVTTMDADELED